MPLIRPAATLQLTAVTSDVLANVPQLQNAGPGDYCITPIQNHFDGTDYTGGTLTVNDGRANVLSSEPIPTVAAAYSVKSAPSFVQGQKQYFVRCVQGQRLIVNVGGTVATTAKVQMFIEKYA